MKRAVLALLVLFVISGCAPDAGEPGTTPAADGKAVYARNCASCHGLEGDGQGEAAYLLFPKPRNFRAANYKLRSSPQGALPTDADLRRTIRTGMPGTAMFGFGELLSDAEIDAVSDTIKGFSPRFEDAGPPSEDELLEIPEPPEMTANLAAEGRQVYERMRCAQCHGPEGRGDGPAAPTLRDSEGQPFPAADFTKGIYKSGGGARELYRTMLTGMSGTPMPSYSTALETERQQWALVAYLQSLAPGGEVPPATGDPGPITVAAAGDGELPADPAATAWESIEPHRVYMRPLWFRNDYPLFVNVRVARVGDRLALMLEWEDDTHDTVDLGQRSFGDGVAVQLSNVEPPPFVGMGARPDGDVEIWYWRADRQRNADAGEVTDVPDVYPDMMVDRYPFTLGLEPHEGRPPIETFEIGQQEPFITGRDAGNPISRPENLRRPVRDLRAAGFGTLTDAGEPEPRAGGRGVWRDGTYRVVLTTSLAPPEGVDGIDLTTVESVPVAVAVWDGSAGDRNGTKLVSQWVTLEAFVSSSGGE